ncbi:MAG: efflux RND transporter permease subunit [Balneolaceae bacterium]|nr:efflux RND transporter permease subunit [Balneolaceae bacterium]
MYFRMVEVKMLPFDNKNEVQLIIDMPEGTTLERTNAVAREVGISLKDLPELKDYQIYAGLNAPINFNGLVRHYDLRRQRQRCRHPAQPGGERRAKRSEPRHRQAHSSHRSTGRAASTTPTSRWWRSRPARRCCPPWWPRSTARTATQRARVAGQVMDIFREHGRRGGCGLDAWRRRRSKYRLDVNTEKAMLSGIPSGQVVETVTMALEGMPVSRLYSDREVNEIPIVLELPEGGSLRHSAAPASSTCSRHPGSMVPVADLVSVREETLEPSIHRKNQRRVMYVTAEVAGAIESPVYAILDAGEQIAEIDMPAGYSLEQIFAGQPFMQEDYTLKWDGEWQITYEVFRDLGIAFAVVLVIIYMLIIGWFQDFKVPIIMMIAIPLSLVGIMIGHWLLGAFFTATSMIGMIALAGIMVRNSVLLIDFINLRLKDGISLKQAVIEAGAVRSMPILADSRHGGHRGGRDPV